MKHAALLLALAALAACDPSGATRPAEEPAAKTQGITISGTVRTGVSKTF